MTFNVQRISAPRRGRPIDWRQYRAMAEAANRIRTVTGDGRYIAADIVADSLNIRWVGPPIVYPSAAKRMRVKTIENDYLVCVPWDGATEGEAVNVAKPFKLRHILANYDDLTGLTTVTSQRVQATDGATIENWQVTLNYEEDDEIAAIKPIGGAGVTVGDTDLDWLDVNENGRAWAVEC